jgi:hypothetical protein
MLLVLVDRHLRALRLNLDPTYPNEEWGFTAEHAGEKLLPATPRRFLCSHSITRSWSVQLLASSVVISAGQDH